MNNLKSNPKDIKKIFWEKGPCSHAFFYILNRDFGHLKEAEEFASDQLSGGLMYNGYQCGMLWGASLAVGAESFRRNNDRDKATGIAIAATQHLMESFTRIAKSVDCQDITSCDVSSKLGLVKYFLLGKPVSCTYLAAKWAPEAIQAADEGLSLEQIDLPHIPISCASVVVKKMGAGDEEMTMVAGFAGGLGLSGNACGALSAAIWMNNLAWCRKNPGKSPYSNTSAESTLKAFYGATDSEILCKNITGQSFKTIKDHTEFIKCGGCDKLINIIARS
jgi:hypothetical protein